MDAVLTHADRLFSKARAGGADHLLTPAVPARAGSRADSPTPVKAEASPGGDAALDVAMTRRHEPAAPCGVRREGRSLQ